MGRDAYQDGIEHKVVVISSEASLPANSIVILIRLTARLLGLGSPPLINGRLRPFICLTLYRTEHSHDYLKVCRLPISVVCDGGYASKKNVSEGRSLGLKHVVFHKRVGISYKQMGVKIKTFQKLRNFRAGVESNISELKRAFGAGNLS